jgi:hypothetical protein
LLGLLGEGIVMMEQGLFVYVGSEVYEFATDAKKRERVPSD